MQKSKAYAPSGMVKMGPGSKDGSPLVSGFLTQPFLTYLFFSLGDKHDAEYPPFMPGFYPPPFPGGPGPIGGPPPYGFPPGYA